MSEAIFKIIAPVEPCTDEALKDVIRGMETAARGDVKIETHRWLGLALGFAREVQRLRAKVEELEAAAP